MRIPGRAFVYSLLFLLTAISYLDRVNLSVAAGPIARELHLGPVQLGWIFSGFLWTYIVFSIPSGSLADRVGFRYLAPAAVTFWSLATAATGAISGMVGLLASRLGVGLAEANAWPTGTRAVRAWAPRAEYGRAISAIAIGQTFGSGFGALLVGWLVREWGWRSSFVICGAIGLVWALVWLLYVRDPQQARWLHDDERVFILQTRDENPPTPAASGGYARVLRTRAMWGVMLSQGCTVYAVYMLLTWLPNYLQTQRGIAIFASGVYTAIIYGTATVGCLLLAYATDKIFTVEALRHGARKTAVALSFLPALLMAAVPWLGSTWWVVAVLAIAVTFQYNVISLNNVLCTDLVLNPRNAARAVSALVCGSNLIGVMAPIVTGYIVGSSKSFNAAFVLTGVILLVGVVILLALTTGGIGEAAEEQVEVVTGLRSSQA